MLFYPADHTMTKNVSLKIIQVCLGITLTLFSSSTPAKEWPFTVYLDGKEIGQHRFSLNEANGLRELTSQAKFNVKFLFINAYQYQHTANERWQGDCLSSLDASTKENREITLVKGRMKERSFLLEAAKKTEILPACVMTFAYWNPKILSQNKLLNPQTGEWLEVKIKALGVEPIEVKGQTVSAERYRIDASKLQIELWYSADKAITEKKWLALKSTTPEGYEIFYKLR